MTTAIELLAALRVNSLRKVTVAGQVFHVRGLTGAERVLLQQRAKDENPMSAHEIVALATCDEAGRPLFTSEQAAELANVDGSAVDEIATQILKASKLIPEGDDAKNSGATPNA